MKISEEAIREETLANIAGAAREGAELINVDPDKAGSAEIIKLLDAYVSKAQDEELGEVDTWTEISLPLGSLWGQTLVKEFNWNWASAIFHEHDESTAVGVFSPDRALAVYPFYFIFGCLENYATVTIELAYNMLREGDAIPELPKKGYENLMDGVHHIIPPK